MNSIQDILIETNNAMYELAQSMDCVKADAIGLDPRAGWVYVGEDCIIVDGSTRAIDYYGGFEYVDSESRVKLGDYTIFTPEDSRVQDAIDCYMESLEEATEEE